MGPEQLRPFRPRLAEALGIVAGRSAEEMAALLAGDGHGEYILVWEGGIDTVQPTSLVRTPLLAFPPGDGHTAWTKLCGAGLAVYQKPGRGFACRMCDGFGRTRAEGDRGEIYYEPCAFCRQQLVFSTPARVCDAISFAADAARIDAFEKRVRRDTEKVLAWRLRRLDDRGPADQAMKGPKYLMERQQNDPQRLWATFPEV